jgi:hypothetical protein
LDFFERKDQYDESWYDKVHQLDELLTVKPYEELEEMLYGRSERRTEPEPEPERPVSRSRARSEEPVERSQPRSRGRRPEPEPEENKCPFGHVFGTDYDNFTDCDNCEEATWSACGVAKAELDDKNDSTPFRDR